MNTIISKIKKELKRQSDPQTKASGRRFFKEEIKLYGVKTALVSKIAKEFDKEIKAMDKNKVFELCEELWQSGFMEESFIACHWSYIINKNYLPADFKVFEKWVNEYVSNWASWIPCATIRSGFL